MAQTTTPTRNRNLLWRWGFVMRTCNPPPGKVDIVSKWLVLVRACVFPLTITSAAIGGLLAWYDANGANGISFDPGLFGLAALGLLLAHAANNLMNDYFDLDTAVDTATYPRALYAPPFETVTRSGVGWEKVGSRLFSGIGGVHVVEAAKSLYAAATPGLPQGAAVALTSN